MSTEILLIWQHVSRIKLQRSVKSDVRPNTNLIEIWEHHGAWWYTLKDNLATDWWRIDTVNRLCFFPCFFFFFFQKCKSQKHESVLNPRSQLNVKVCITNVHKRWHLLQNEWVKLINGLSPFKVHAELLEDKQKDTWTNR